MPEGNNFLKNSWPAISWAIFILILCGIPGTKIPALTFLEWLRPDKIAHLIIFGIQSYLLMQAFTKQNVFPVLNRKAVLFSLLITIAYGCLVEILQEILFVHRSGDIRDAIANGLGALLGILIYKKRRNKSEERNRLGF